MTARRKTFSKRGSSCLSDEPESFSGDLFAASLLLTSTYAADLAKHVDPEDKKASEVRKWMFDAVEGHTDDVNQKGSCIRVRYADGYHVDLVTYATQKDAANQEIFHLASKSIGWRPADPPGLDDYIQNARKPYEDTEDGRTSTLTFPALFRRPSPTASRRSPVEASIQRMMGGTSGRSPSARRAQTAFVSTSGTSRFPKRGDVFLQSGRRSPWSPSSSRSQRKR